MADVVIQAAYASVVEDEGRLFVGFAEGEDEGEPYVLFAAPVDGGSVWFELEEEGFGAEEAVEALALVPGRLTITLKAGAAGRFGFVRVIEVRLDACDEAEAALEALRGMMGARFAA